MYRSWLHLTRLMNGKPAGLAALALAAFVFLLQLPTFLSSPKAMLVLVVRRNGWQTSVSDGLLLGYAVGAGFAFHEDAIKRVTSGSGWTATSWSALFPTLLYQSGRPTLGHDGWTALVGLALGLTTLLRHRPRARLIALAALAIVIADHGTANWIGRQGRHLPALVGGANVLLLNGHLAILLLATGITTAVFMD